MLVVVVVATTIVVVVVTVVVVVVLIAAILAIVVSKPLLPLIRCILARDQTPGHVTVPSVPYGYTCVTVVEDVGSDTVVL